jgi:hypothetical protein
VIDSISCQAWKTLPCQRNHFVRSTAFKMWLRKRAHLPLQTRVKALNGEVGTVFRQCYPDFPAEEEETQAA